MMPNMQSIVHEAACLNRNAANSAALGNGAEACQVFKSALLLMSNITMDLPEHVEEHLSTSDHFSHRNISSLPLGFPQDHDPFYIYNKILLFEPRLLCNVTPLQQQVLVELDYNFYSAALIFNLALVYHQQASVTHSLKLYFAADRMYQKSLEIIRLFPGDSNMDALELAVRNNRAHISWKCGNFDDMESTMEEIRNFSCMLLLSRSFSPQLDESTINQIIINTVVSCRALCAPSA